MKYQTHNTKTINICGTSLQGECPDHTTYKLLTTYFGKHADGDKYKVDAEWIIEFDDGTVATIYNYKSGKNYNGRSGTPKTKLTGTDWHIGGFNKKAQEKVIALLDTAHPIMAA